MVTLSREPTPDELTVREAARLAHRGEETIRRWIWSGRLPARKLGNVYYIRYPDLQIVLDENYPHGTTTGGESPLAQWLDEVRAWQAGLGPRRHFTDEDVAEIIRRGRQERDDELWEASTRDDDH